MDNNSDLPDGWAMPDDMTKKISEVLDKKRITPEDELADALEDMARDIALIEPNPVDWGGLVIYFLDQLEEESKRRMRGIDFNSILEALVKELQDRMRNNR